MDIRQLTYFLEVAKQMSFSKAAVKLNVTQPTLSKMVKNLEEELGVVLFDRSTKHMHLTDAGKIVLGQAQEIVKLIQNLSSELSDMMMIKKGTITIGLPPVIGSLFFPKLIRDFHDLYPQIQVELVEEGAKTVEKLVEEASVDFGCAVMPINEELFETYPFAYRELKLIVHHEHRLADSEQISLLDLQQESFIMLREDFALHDRIREACIQVGFEPQIAYASSQWDFISEMVANRLGVAILPETICPKFDQGRIKTISIAEPRMPWDLALIWRKNKYLSYAAREFIQFFRHHFHDTFPV